MASVPAEAAGVDRAEMPVPSPGLALAGIMLASILPILDTTIANVAIPHMQSSLGAGPQSVTWVLTSYIVMNAIAMPITGWLAQKTGPHRLYVISVLAFIVTSVMCGMAQNLTQMVLFRALQGISGAFIFPLSQSILLDISPPSRHSSMMATLGLGTILGPIMGPLIGGWLTENWDWRWVFLVNLPLGFLALLLLVPNLPRYVARNRPFDLFGFGLIAICLASLQLMLDRGQEVDWFEAAETWIYLGAFLATLWMTVVHLATHRHPIFERGMFADRNLLIAITFMAINAVVIYTTMALMPPMLQHLFGYDVIDTGMVLAPRGVGAMIAMQVANRMLISRIDPRVPITIGYICTIYSLWHMAHWSLEVDQATIIWFGFIQGLGVGLVSLPMFVIAFVTLEPRYRTEASSLLNLARLLGSSVGISIAIAFFARNTQISHADLAGHVTSASSDFVDVASVSQQPLLGEVLSSIVNAEITRQAAMVAYVDDYWMIMWATIVTMPLVAFVRRPKQAAAEADPAAAGGH